MDVHSGDRFMFYGRVLYGCTVWGSVCFKGEYYMDVQSGDLYVLRERIIWMYILGICMF